VNQVRQSYFGEMLGVRSRPALTPARPVSTLWKAARLERIAAESATVPSPVLPRRPVASRRAQFVEADPAPQAASHVRADSGAPGAVRKKEARMPAHPDSVRAPVSIGAAPPTRTPDPPPEPARPMLERVEETRSTPRLRVTPADPVSMAASPEPRRRPAAPGAEEEPLQTAVVPEPPVARQAAPPASPVPAFVSSRTATEPSKMERPPELSPVFAPRDAPVVIPPPRLVGTRTIGECQAAPLTPQPNQIHVGRIEVQVISPPPVARSSAPPRTGRLAQGYALCFGVSRP
jgi:hypothetical protein